ncbi:flagellin lysine-N-methylase [Yersinia intermedia]|uniref:flagellin lysine-N-methylase n=1 Tax=Yersinia intermedia TaxID=631 RepID=UPI0011A261A5|nr:flagellin lysine-N-methylase [Yersinia intermedia]MDA5480123.1 flagellin lysine-N-methylase [Yersinia intermedia]
MKELQIIQPEFVKSFNCIGSDCRDHCCHGWDINLDKNTYRKYKNSQNQSIRNIAVKNITVTRTNPSNWAKIRLKSDGNCPYLDESRLCEVHKRLGSEALSNTCSTYPRSSHKYKTEQFNTLTLSCPEVARLVLFNPHAFTLHEETVQQKQYFNDEKINTEGQFIHYYCNQIVTMPNDNFEENIYAVHVFMHCCKNIDSTVDDKLQMIFELYTTIRSKLQAGDIREEVAKITFNANARWHFLMIYQRYTVSAMGTRGHKTLFNYMAFLIHHLMNEVDVNQLEERMAMLSATWNDRVMPLLNQHPHILRNFFQYNFYHNQFALSKIDDIDKDFHSYVIDFFIIKSVISAFVIHNGTLSEDDIINIVYSYSIFKLHKSNAQSILLSSIDKVNESDDFSLLNMLN